MIDRVLKIYTDEGLGNDNPTFYDIELTEYNFNAPRMGMPQLTATLKYHECLDNKWTEREYVVIRGERYYIKHVQTSEQKNTDLRYIHSLSFLSERDELFSDVYFFDMVYSGSSVEDKPCSNSPSFKFYGTIGEAVDRFNCALRYAGIGDSSLISSTNPYSERAPQGDGYYCTIDKFGDGDLEKTYNFEFSNVSLWEAMKQIYEKSNIGFAFIGKEIRWNIVDKVIDHVFKYGFDNELLSVKKTNTNAKIINRITMLGSSENIPYYYPNETEYGHIQLTFKNNTELNKNSVIIKNYNKFLYHVRADEYVECVWEVIDGKSKVSWVVGKENEQGEIVDGKRYDDISFLGLELLITPNSEHYNGQKIGWKTLYTMPYQEQLVPPIYRTTKGSERFYNAINNHYPVPNTEDEYFEFKHPYIQGNPHEHIYEDKDKKPTIEGIRNDVIDEETGLGQLFGAIADIAFDIDDNDELKIQGDSGDALKYTHSFFYIKLNKFSGKYGFNLIDRASQTDPMIIQMTSGDCNGLKFKIQVLEKEDVSGYKYFENPIQIDDDGNLYKACPISPTGKTNPLMQNTETNSIWIAVQKDTETFGQIYPSLTKNIVPKIGDTFNIINITLPQQYVDAAEEDLMNDGIAYMSDNNEDKFTFDISLSRIFLAEHPEIQNMLDEYAKIDVEYNNVTYRLYVSTLSVSQKSNDVLPDIQVSLVDTISVGSTFAQKVNEQVIGLMASYSKGLLSTTAAERRYLNKERADRTPFNLSVGGELIAENVIRSRDFASGLTGYGWGISQKGDAEADSLTLRKFLEVPELRFNRAEVICGTQWRAPGGGIIESVTQTDGTHGTVTLKLEEGELGAIAVDDLCMGVFHKINEDGTSATSNATSDSDDRKGNFTYAGFTTVYFRITSVSEDLKSFEYVLREGTTQHPAVSMNFVGYGNKTNTDRQRSYYATRSYERYLANVDDWEFDESNIMMQMGDLSGLTINGESMAGYSAYLNNVYFSGVLRKLHESGYLSNLLFGTLGFSAPWVRNMQAIYSETYQGFTIAKASSNSITQKIRIAQQETTFEKGKTYTLSFLAKGTGMLDTYCHTSNAIVNGEKTMQTRILRNSISQIVEGTTVDTHMSFFLQNAEFARHYVTFVVDDIDPTQDQFVTFDCGALSNVSVCAVMLIEGDDYDLGWQPAASEREGTKGDKGDQGEAGKDGKDGASYTPNLLEGTETFKGDNWQTFDSVFGGKINNLQYIACTNPATLNTRREVVQYNGLSLIVNREYTLSFLARGEGVVQSFIYPDATVKVIAPSEYNASDGSCTHELTSDWKRYYVSVRTLPSGPLLDKKILLRAPSGTKVEVAGLKLELGVNSNPQWTPSTDEMLGKEGKTGPSGAVMRIRGAFDATQEYSDGTTIDSDGIRWIDVVWIDSAYGERYYYVCSKSLGATMNPPTASADGGNANWEPMSNLGNLYADMIFAQNARIEFLSGQEIVFGENLSNGATKIWGRIGVPTKDTVQITNPISPQSDLTGGGIVLPGDIVPARLVDIILWLGNSTAETSTMTIDKKGFTRYGTLKNKRIEVDPDEKEVRIYNDDGKMAVQIDGDVHDVADLYGCNDELVKVWSGDTCTATLDEPSKNYNKNLGSFTTRDPAHIKLTMPIVAKAGTIKLSGGTTGADLLLHSSVSATLTLQSLDDEDYVVNEEYTYSTYGDNTMLNGGEKQINETLTIDWDVPSGSYKVSVSVSASHNVEQGVAPECFLSIQNYRASLKVGDSPMSMICANGMFIANSTQDFLSAAIKGAEGFVVEAHVGEMGVKLDSEGLKALDINTNTYRKIKLTFEN